jgi:drug/metabolite transporter (DMT)-like permease
VIAAGSRARSSAGSLSPRASGQLTLLGACLIWGINFSVIPLLLHRLHPLDVSLLRTMTAAASFVTLLLLLRRGRPRFTRAEWTRLITMGLLGVAIVNTVSSIGQSHLPATISSLLMTSSPIFTAIFAALLGMEVLDRRMGIALAMATIGLFILVSWGRGATVELNATTLISVALLVLVPICWASYTVLNKPMLSRHPPLEMAAYGMIIGAILLLPLAFTDPTRVGRIVHLDAAGWGLALFSSIGSQVIGFVAFSRALQSLTPSEAAMSTYLTPVFGILVAWLVLGEQPTLGLVIGGGMILAAMILVSTRKPVRVDATPAGDPGT